MFQLLENTATRSAGAKGRAMGRRAVDNSTVVTQEVNRLLEASPAYRNLPVDEQRTMAGSMVRIGLYLAAPEDIPANVLTGALAAVPAQAARSDLLAAVNFPAFVAGLIQGVFQAIVDASIEQMQAYGELVASVAKRVDQFGTDRISDDSARKWLAGTYPECFDSDPQSGDLRLRSGGDCARLLPRLCLLLEHDSLRDIPPEDVEKKLVPAARRRLVANRQQTLATMVMMGINRIVVTDGSIGSGRPL
jgi:hypothetical protein